MMDAPKQQQQHRYHRLSAMATLARHGGNLCEVIRAVEETKQEGLMHSVSSDIIYCLIKGCLKKKDHVSARRIHHLIMGTHLGSITFLNDNLIRLFATCGALQEAYDVFLHVQNRTAYTCNSMISAFTKFGENGLALSLYNDMKCAGIMPDKVTFLSILKACTDIDHIRYVHGEILEHGFEFDVSVWNTILAAYCKCSDVKDAENVFNSIQCKDVVTWSVMISGYAEYGNGWLALDLFQNMRQVGIAPNILTFSSLMKACSSIGDIHESFYIHDEFLRSHAAADSVIEGALVDMYAKCGGIREARKVFDDIFNPDIVSWGAMILGYVMQEDAIAALTFFEKLEQTDLKPNRAIYLSVTKACGSLRAIDQGRFAHYQIIKSGLEADVAVGTVLADMYIRCGSLSEAFCTSKELQNPDAITWGTKVSGYASHGSSSLAWECLKDMQQCGLRPGDAAFTSILTACGHTGLLVDGHHYFRTMREVHGVVPNIEHFSCMIDLFGRAGLVQEAEALLCTMPVCPDVAVWRSFLTSCKSYNNVNLARECFDRACILYPDNASGYVLMSSMYAAVNMWEDVEHIETRGNWLVTDDGSADRLDRS